MSPKRQHQPLFAQRNEVVVIAADGARRTAHAMDLQRGQAAQVGREEQRLHLVRDGQFAFHALLLFLLGDEVGQRGSWS